MDKIIFNGITIASGDPEQDAIRSLTYTESVNSDADLVPGTVGIGTLDLELYSKQKINAGDKIEWYRDDELRGTFWAGKPTRGTVYSVTAYDVLSKTEKDLSAWLRGIQEQFPISLFDFARQVCEQCGLTLVNTEIPNGNYQIRAFYTDDFTARKGLEWVGQVCGRFCRATPDGEVEFAWYTPPDWKHSLGPGEDGLMLVRLTGETLRVADRDAAVLPDGPEIYRVPIKQTWYYQLSYEDFETALIDKVQINQSENDVGVIYPADAVGTNALTITGNLLLTTDTDENLRPVSKTLYEQFKEIQYTPCQVEVPPTSDLRAGMAVWVKTPEDTTILTYITDCTIDTTISLESVGNASRDETTAVNTRVEKNLRGRMLEIQTSVDGLNVKASELSGDFSELNLTVDGLTSTVERNKKETDEQLGEVETQLRTEIKQTVEGISLTAENGDDKSVLSLKAGETTLSSADIVFVGSAKFVTHDQLSTAGETVIDGGNIKTGIVQNYDGTTIYDLVAGTIQMGATSAAHIKITKDTVRWYLGSDRYPNDNGPTGVFHSVEGSSWIGATSRYIYYGHIPANNYNSYYGMRIEQGKYAHFNVKKVECNGENDNSQGTFEANTVTCNNLTVRNGKGRIMDTADYGIVTMEAMESPMPVFCDNGSGVLNEDGECLLTLHPVFLETVAANVTPQWHATASAPVTVRKEGLTAVVKGEPGATFDWLCILPQKGREGTYAKSTDISREEYAGAQDYISQMELENVQNQIDELDRQIFTVAQENNLIETVFPEEVSA